MVGPPLLLGLLAALTATRVQATTWRSKAEVAFNLPIGPVPAVSLTPHQSKRLTSRPISLESLTRSPALAVRVVQAAAVPGITAAQFLRHSSAKSRMDTGILTLSVTYRPRAAAVRLTNAYATAFVQFKNVLLLRQVQELSREYEAPIKSLRARGQTGTFAYKTLVALRSELRMPTASVLSLADGASSFRPHALRNGLLGGGLGALLGLAFTLGVAARPRRRA